MELSIIYGDTYENIHLKCQQFGIRQWKDGTAKLLIEFADGSYKEYDLNAIKTINVTTVK